MTDTDIEELLKDPILPYPHQGSEREYPEYDKYGDLWESATPDSNRAKDYVRSYNQFRNNLLALLQQSKNGE